MTSSINKTETTYNPLDYHFHWTAPTTKKKTDLGDYEWDKELGYKAAKAARDKECTKLRNLGYHPVKYQVRNSACVKGGKSQKRPEVVGTVTLYGIRY